MAEQITLRYGGRLLTLTKSGRLAAVRIRPGRHGALRRALAALPATAGRPSATGQVLGGFHLIDLGAGTHAEADARLDLLRRDGAVAACSHVFHTSDDGVPFVPTGEIYVRFRPGADVTARAALLDRFALDAVERRAEDTLVVRIEPGSPNPVRTAAALQTSAIVAVAEPDMATPGQMRGAEPPPPVGAPLTDGGTAAGGLEAADAAWSAHGWPGGRSVPRRSWWA